MNCDTYLATVTLQKERRNVVLTSPDRAPVFSQGESGRQGEWVGGGGSRQAALARPNVQPLPCRPTQLSSGAGTVPSKTDLAVS